MTDARLEILHHAREGRLLGSVSTARTLQTLAEMVDTALENPTREEVEKLDKTRLRLVLARVINAWREYHAPCVEVERAMTAAKLVLDGVP